jgi:predicted DCC family thiol-disulfide oxidoreductase YuxK
MDKKPAPPLTVYYDGSCPLCRREIGFYRRRVPDDAIEWIDVSAPVELGEGLSCTTAMARFHVREANGRLHSGGIAFATLWRHVPGWRWLGRIGSRRPLSWLLELGYRVFLPLRPKLQRLVRRREAPSAAKDIG